MFYYFCIVFALARTIQCVSGVHKQTMVGWSDVDALADASTDAAYENYGSLRIILITQRVLIVARSMMPLLITKP